ncbi:MAG: calcium/sodium antiporter [Verrucomicrobiae bacterium]|nr:calcium/sodium antiporter [Verrucomicrobiae bacterium]MCP5542059.1 calcium/sodium antiporter [Akkermansiaceae bacterium]MCP5551037.1 calcium/sodium antiporter [Akkermansiaceae bacterium]
MHFLIDLLWLLGGLVALYFGAEWLVGGSAKLAVRFGITPLVVGLTVVAFGTSAPELFVSFRCNLDNLPDMAVGNVVGSNICNIGLILGVSALFYGLAVKSELLRRDIPVLLGATAFFLFTIYDKTIARWEGAVLATGIVAYTVLCLRLSKREADPEVLGEFEAEFNPDEARTENPLKLAGLILAGLVLLAVGAEALKRGGISIATALGVPEAVISLTLIAFATSVPELATSIIAAAKKEGDIIIGNVIGSCVFNLLCVIGFTALGKPVIVSQIDRVDLAVMLGFTVILIPMMFRGRVIDRKEGILLLAGYTAYVAWLYLSRAAA